MRQAGRYMADYRALRERYSLLEICRDTGARRRRDAAAGRRIDVDAAILFSGSAAPASRRWGSTSISCKGEGPAIERPDATCLGRRTHSHLRAARGARPRAHDDPPAAPASSTDACRSSVSAARHSRWPRTRSKAGRQRLREDEDLHVLAAGRVARALWQVRLGDGRLSARAGRGGRAGRAALRFVGRPLSRHDYREFAQPHTASIFNALAGAGVPTLHFGVGTTRFSRHARRRRRRHRRRLAPSNRRSLDAYRARSRRAGEPRSDDTARSAERRWPRRMTSCGARPGGRATSSISATESCRRRRAHERAGARATRARLHDRGDSGPYHHRRRGHHRADRGVRAARARSHTNRPRGRLPRWRTDPDRSRRRIHDRGGARLGALDQAAALDLARELGLGEKIQEVRTPGAFVLRGTRLFHLPSPSVLGLPLSWRALFRYDLLPWSARLRLARSFVLQGGDGGDAIRNDDISVAEFFRNRFGAATVD